MLKVVRCSTCFFLLPLQDEILMSMQQKLDDLCEQMNCMKDQSQEVTELSASKNLDFSSRRLSFPGKSDSICTDCWFCDQRRVELDDLSVRLWHLPNSFLLFIVLVRCSAMINRAKT